MLVALGNSWPLDKLFSVAAQNLACPLLKI